jgi:hypothetical protein
MAQGPRVRGQLQESASCRRLTKALITKTTSPGCSSAPGLIVRAGAAKPPPFGDDLKFIHVDLRFTHVAMPGEMNGKQLATVARLNHGYARSRRRMAGKRLPSSTSAMISCCCAPTSSCRAE